jgi:MFS family permease
MTTTIDATGTGPRTDLHKVKRAATAAFLGSMLEYYEFYIYASAAALVFGKVFFPSSSAATGTLLSLATFGVAYIARPIGAVLLGHLGDRVGRKKIMLFTLGLMGTATFLIGCLPEYKHIGIWAPILLVCLRVCQGISAAGEQSGANSLTLEHSPEHRRAFFTSWTLTGTQAGFILATLVFLSVATLPEDQLLSWGWRIPFLASAIVVFAAYIARRKLEEPEVFTENRENGELERFPVATLLRTHATDVLRVILCAFQSVGGTIFSVFGLAFATSAEVGISRPTMLWAAVVANVVALFMQPSLAVLADRIGRKPVFISGVVGLALSIFFYFWAISTANVALIYVGAIIFTGICYSAPNAIFPTF